jgi:hypothetical protein
MCCPSAYRYIAIIVMGIVEVMLTAMMMLIVFSMYSYYAEPSVLTTVDNTVTLTYTEDAFVCT